MRLHRLLCVLFLAASLACASTSQRGARALAAREEAREPGVLRLMTYNIKYATRGMDGIAEVLRAANPDIVALQEVDSGSRRAGGADQATVLAERTGLPYHVHFRTRDVDGGAYGIALLSRFPLETLEQYALPVPPGGEPRTVAHALMRVEGREVSVYLTHLTHPPFRNRTRLRQSVFISELLARDPRPRILMGDLNDGPDSRPVRLLRRHLRDTFAASGSGPSGTFQLPVPLLAPTVRLDYVLACDAFTPLRSRVLRVNASDHFPVVADVRLEEARAGGGTGPERTGAGAR
jgi:endonuclease/exonuclease/phosphatase family metal-dependent hydrolase